MHEIHFRVGGMKWPAVHSASRGPANHHGHRRVPQVVGFRDEVGHLIETAGDEIDELHLDDRPQAQKTHAARRSDNSGLGDGRIHHPVRARTRQQPFGHFERTAIHTDVFAHRDNRGVALHFLKDRLTDRFQHGDWRHVQALPGLPAGRLTKFLRGGLPGFWCGPF